MLVPADFEYLDLLREVAKDGERRETRNGIVRSLFGRAMYFDLAAGFPLLTTKRVFFKGVVEELLWMLRGETNVRSLQAAGVHIWDEWADAEGELGPVYGAQWRRWDACDGRGVGIDQIAKLIDGLRHNAFDRGHIISAWNVRDLEAMNLRPCHVLAQWYVHADGRLDCQLYQRSADLFLGVPFNIASYALLTSMLAHVTDLQPGRFTHVLGDVHLYENHLQQAKLQLQRFPRMPPLLALAGPALTLDGWDRSMVRLRGYDAHPEIRAEISR